MSVRSAVKQAIFIICAAYPASLGKDQLDGYKALAEQALEPYTDAMLMQLAHPRHGIIGKSKFLPSIAELRGFCEAELDREWRKRPVANDDEPPLGIEYRGETPEQRAARRKSNLDRWEQIKQEMAANDMADQLKRRRS